MWETRNKFCWKPIYVRSLKLLNPLAEWCMIVVYRTCTCSFSSESSERVGPQLCATLATGGPLLTVNWHSTCDCFLHMWLTVMSWIVSDHCTESPAHGCSIVRLVWGQMASAANWFRRSLKDHICINGPTRLMPYWSNRRDVTGGSLPCRARPGRLLLGQ